MTELEMLALRETRADERNDGFAYEDYGDANDCGQCMDCRFCANGGTYCMLRDKGVNPFDDCENFELD